MRAVEACWRAMDRAVRNYEALGVIRGQKVGYERNCTSGAYALFLFPYEP